MPSQKKQSRILNEYCNGIELRNKVRNHGKHATDICISLV